MGYKLLPGPVHTLDVEFGLGATRTSFVDSSADQSGAVGIAALNYVGRINDNVTLSQRLSAEAGSDNTLLASTTGLKVKMTDAFSLGLSHLIKRNSDIVGANGDKTDSLTTVNVIYGF